MFVSSPGQRRLKGINSVNGPCGSNTQLLWRREKGLCIIESNDSAVDEYLPCHVEGKKLHSPPHHTDY